MDRNAQTQMVERCRTRRYEWSRTEAVFEPVVHPSAAQQEPVH
jgi:hypothetical protein